MVTCELLQAMAPGMTALRLEPAPQESGDWSICLQANASAPMPNFPKELRPESQTALLKWVLNHDLITNAIPDFSSTAAVAAKVCPQHVDVPSLMVLQYPDVISMPRHLLHEVRTRSATATPAAANSCKRIDMQIAARSPSERSCNSHILRLLPTVLG